MIQRLIVNTPISALSIGQVGFNLLRELYRQKVQCVIFPIGGVDLSPFKVDPQFAAWLEQSINSRYTRIDRRVPTLKNWHIRDSESRLSDKQILLSWHETDSPQPSEVNIVNQQDHTFFTSSWSVDNFRTFGGQNVSFTPLGLDPDFTPSDERLVSADVTHWVMAGKFEAFRKMTDHKIRTWIRKYGGNAKHQLTLCVTNPFYIRERNGFNTDDLLAQAFQGAKPFNVNVLPPLKTNAEMLQFYRSADIDLSGFSRAEGHNIPAHTVTALGKWSVVSNCTAHKDWATSENSILVEPNGMVKAVDNHFFVENAPFSSGNMYSFSDEAFIEGLEKAEKKAKTPNVAGLKLAAVTYQDTVREILAKL